MTFASKTVFDRLDKNPHADPTVNFKKLESEIIDSMNSHIEKKIVKFNRKKHKEDPWITVDNLWHPKICQ